MGRWTGREYRVEGEQPVGRGCRSTRVNGDPWIFSVDLFLLSPLLALATVPSSATPSTFRERNTVLRLALGIPLSRRKERAAETSDARPALSSLVALCQRARRLSRVECEGTRPVLVLPCRSIRDPIAPIVRIAAAGYAKPIKCLRNRDRRRASDECRPSRRVISSTHPGLLEFASGRFLRVAGTGSEGGNDTSAERSRNGDESKK